MLINCEINLNLTWSENCIISEFETRESAGGKNPVKPATGAIFSIAGTYFYVPEVTLSTKNSTLLQQLQKLA